MVYVHITHHDNGLVVGTVPFLIVVAEHLGLEVVDHLHLADGHTLSVLAAGIELGQSPLNHAHGGAGTGSPFLVDYTSLLVNLLGGEGQSVGPIVEDEQTGVE